MLNCGLRRCNFQPHPRVVHTWQGRGSPASLQWRNDGKKGEMGKSGGQWTQGTTGCPLGIPIPAAMGMSTPAGSSCLGRRAHRPLRGLFLPWFSLFSYGSPSQAAREKYAFIFRARLLTPTPLCSSANVRETSSGFKRQPEMCVHAQSCFIFTML